MNKKDYIRLAGIIARQGNRNKNVIVLDNFVDELYEWFHADNPRFDKEKFDKACFSCEPGGC